MAYKMAQLCMDVMEVFTKHGLTVTKPPKLDRIKEVRLPADTVKKEGLPKYRIKSSPELSVDEVIARNNWTLSMDFLDQEAQDAEE